MTIVYSKPNILKFQADAKASGDYLGAIDGIWGPKSEAAFIAYMKEKTYDGATFPYDDYKYIKVVLDGAMNEYVEALKPIQAPKGLKLLATAMTDMEGFRKGSTSYITNNPANRGNRDDVSRRRFNTLAEGIADQLAFIKDIAAGKVKGYPLGKDVLIPPLYSSEIQRNRETYGIPPQCPGYHFTPYTGRLDEFTKIYSTGARILAVYVNQIVSFFKDNGITLTPESTLAEIIA